MVNVACVTELSVMMILLVGIVIARASGLGQVVAEPVEASLPAGPALGDPVLGSAERGRLDAAGADPASLLRTHQPACLKHLDVLDNRRQRHRQRPGQLAD